MIVIPYKKTLHILYENYANEMVLIDLDIEYTRDYYKGFWGVVGIDKSHTKSIFYFLNTDKNEITEIHFTGYIGDYKYLSTLANQVATNRKLISERRTHKFVGDGMVIRDFFYISKNEYFFTYHNRRLSWQSTYKKLKTEYPNPEDICISIPIINNDNINIFDIRIYNTRTKKEYSYALDEYKNKNERLLYCFKAIRDITALIISDFSLKNISIVIPEIITENSGLKLRENWSSNVSDNLAMNFEETPSVILNPSSRIIFNAQTNSCFIVSIFYYSETGWRDRTELNVNHFIDFNSMNIKAKFLVDILNSFIIVVDQDNKIHCLYVNISLTGVVKNHNGTIRKTDKNGDDLFKVHKITHFVNNLSQPQNFLGGKEIMYSSGKFLLYFGEGDIIKHKIVHVLDVFPLLKGLAQFNGAVIYREGQRKMIVQDPVVKKSDTGANHYYTNEDMYLDALDNDPSNYWNID